MSISCFWRISQLECRPEYEGNKDVVSTIHWRRQAVEGDYEADVYGAQTIAFDQSTSFTPYAELTREQVESWLEIALGQEKVLALDSELVAQIESQSTPVAVYLSLPWGQ
jgi:hypothetical protein